MNNIFALHLMKSSEKHYVMIELKNGQSVNGTLAEIDRYMNMHVTDVVLTNSEGTTFHRIPSIYIKGSSIKSVQLIDDILDIHLNKFNNRKQQQQLEKRANKKGNEGGGKGNGVAAGKKNYK